MVRPQSTRKAQMKTILMLIVWLMLAACGSTILAESLAGGRRGSYLYRWLANTLISVSPRLGQMGLALPDGVTADETLAKRLEEEVVAAGSQILGPIQFGAWTRKSLDPFFSRSN
jgi:hypothetical protein